MNKILGVRHWVAPDHTRVVIDTSQAAKLTSQSEKGRLLLDLEDMEYPNHLPRQILLNKPCVEGIILSPQSRTRVRVELLLPPSAKTHVFKLNRYEDKPNRIVIDIVLPEEEKPESEETQQVKVTRKDRIVVIDPGHGGEAVGAVGRDGVFEKDVVLSISRNLRDELNSREGYRALLTRDGDYYVSFNKRLKIARENGADLFISIHADAAKSRQAWGSSVYCLSTRGASSEAAKILARKENLADIIGGVSSMEKGDASDAVLLDMFQTRSSNQSRIFGKGLLKQLEKTNPLKFTSVQEAPFRVLKLPQTPSILIETAYISNPREEKRLTNAEFQKKMALSVATAVVDFLPPLPLVVVSVGNGSKAEAPKVHGVVGGKAIEAGAETKTIMPLAAAVAPVSVKEQPKTAKKASPGGRGAKPGGAVYTVKKGETLANIAQAHGTSLKILLDMNRMKIGDTLHRGRILKLPDVAAANPEGAAKAASKTKVLATAKVKVKPLKYRVQKGDTLEKIARKHGTTIKNLLALNDLKPTGPLYAGRQLLIQKN